MAHQKKVVKTKYVKPALVQALRHLFCDGCRRREGETFHVFYKEDLSERNMKLLESGTLAEGAKPAPVPAKPVPIPGAGPSATQVKRPQSQAAAPAAQSQAETAPAEPAAEAAPAEPAKEPEKAPDPAPADKNVI